MNKAELVLVVAEKVGLSKREAEEVVDTVFAEIQTTLLKGEDVKLSGFGTLAVKTRAERVGTNPSTGEKITIPAAKTITFKVSKALKERL